MKWRFHHKARKAFLTTAICLALSQSVFAMPTGGKVIEGDITGITNGTIASGGTINVAGSGLIDWNAFGIGAGETLNYAFTSPGTLINHVTGADMSQLLGTLNSTGTGNLWLINPNGIVVGSSAQLNAGSLVLSTLNATDEALQGFLHGGDLTLTSADAAKGIEVQSGAKITAADGLNLAGGHIKIADNVTVSASGDLFNMSAVAAKQAGFEGGKTEDGVSSGTAGVGNTLTLGNVTFDIKSPESDVYFIGHDVSLDGTKLNLTSKDASKSSASLDVIAANQFGYEPIAGQDDENGWENFDIGNTLDVKGASLTADYMRLAGGKTTVDGSALTLTKTTDTVKEGYTMPYLMVSALNGKRVIFDDVAGDAGGAENTAGATLTVKDSTLDSQENIALLGGAVSVTNSQLTTAAENDDKDNNIDINAYSTGDHAMPSNAVTVTGGSLVSGGDISVQGGKITFDGVENVKAADGKGIFLVTGNRFSDDINIEEASDANAILVKNTKMSTNDAMALIGGKVDVTDGSNLAAGDLEIVAGSRYTNEGNTIAGTDATNLTVSDATLHSNEDTTLVGSNIKFANTKLEVGTPMDQTYGSNGVVRIAAAKNVTLTDDNTNGFVIGSVNQTGNLTMDKVNLSAYGTVMAYGKTVKLQDSVLSTTNDEDLVINAVNTYKRVNGSSDSWTATPDNTIEVSGSTLTDQGNIELSGGKVTVEKSSLTATGDDGFVDVNARASYTDEDDGPYVNKAVAGMDVNVKDTKLSGDDGVGVFGHTVTVDGDSSLTSKAGKVFLAAGKTVEMTDDSLKGDGAPVNIGKNVKYDASKTLFEPDKKLIETTKPSDPGTKPSDPGTKPSDPGTKPSDPGTKPSDPGTKPSDPGTKPSDPGTKPSDPGTKPSKPPVVTPDPQPAADIAKNIAQGQADMAKALQENPQQAAAAVQQQAEKLSRSTMTETEKVAQLKGYVEAIQATQESAETKNDLLVTVVKSFEPTQQEGITAQTKQDEAAQTKTAKAAVNAAAVSQPTVVPADQTPLVTVDSTAVKD
ncbi:filamentous hemagglutinin N-terminal domain-containing protein [Selenomonas bovis]|uniref:filamentous hemagglutinin N-terminal domain-containing protein n=1 Tax=Selenomonas bovis TaxID=416586 RepID=UPI003D00D732